MLSFFHKSAFCKEEIAVRKKWRVKSEEWRMKNEEWRTKNEEWRIKKGNRRNLFNCLSACERKTRLELATPTLARLCSTNWAISAKRVFEIVTLSNVKRRRLELPRHNCHYPLKVARLPIPPPLHTWKESYTSVLMCPEQDSNLHVSQHSHLKRARLPFRHLGIWNKTLRSADM